ncbi:hypothetical protein Tco_0728913 [Tanacetum coccineum]|uniref:Uncharacterized protein n=1 Tax=Tanacetum coccineum TaxID=301880 RepID=A0ABQ4YQ58_9ASTR
MTMERKTTFMMAKTYLDNFDFDSLNEEIIEDVTVKLRRTQVRSLGNTGVHYFHHKQIYVYVQRAKPLPILSKGKRNLDDINECLLLYDPVSKKWCINEVDVGTNNDHILCSLVSSAYGNKDVSSTFMNNDDVELSTPVMGTQTFSMSKVPVVVGITVGAQNNTGMSMPIQDVRGGSRANLLILAGFICGGGGDRITEAVDLFVGE